MNTAGLTPHWPTSSARWSTRHVPLAGKQAPAAAPASSSGIGTDVPVSDANRALILSQPGQGDGAARHGASIHRRLLGPLQIDPLLFASAAHGEAQAQIGNLLEPLPDGPVRLGRQSVRLRRGPPRAGASSLNGGPAAAAEPAVRRPPCRHRLAAA